MRGWWSRRWRHLLNPQVGGRITERKRWSERRLPLVAWVYYGLSAWMTPRMLAVGFVGILPMLSLFVFTIENTITNFGFLMLTVVLGNLVVGGLSRPRFAVVSEVPERVECGRPFQIRYCVVNRSRRAIHDLSVETLPPVNILELRLSPVPVACLPAGQRCDVQGLGRGLQRGRYRLPPLRCDSDFPMGLWRWGRTDWRERQLAVHPAYARLMSLELPEGARNRLDMQEARQLTREALEFHGCREFRAGDAMRHVHARSSARLGEPVVKEFQAEGRGRTAIIVDTWSKPSWVAPRLRADPVVEASLSLTAAIVDFLARSDRVLELLVAGPGLYRFVSAGRAGFFEEVLDILASVETSPVDTLPQLAPVLVDEIRAIQSVCLVLGRWDARRAAFVNELADFGVGVKTVLVTRHGESREGSGRGGTAQSGEIPPETVHLSSGAILRGEVTSL